ncbi:P-loop containing nucleoside triphosphate hydrolase protein [Ceratobasidium sp. AG-I]|nr:P-loop containing nucleoside triphosphate hydrolase protein [Ceratobasidium sp. AG-I]
MTGLQKVASEFFIFLLLTLVMTLTMKTFFRALAASFERESTVQAGSGIGIMAWVLYTGYTIPTPSMIGALKWIIYINPLRYGFEALIVNGLYGLKDDCSFFAPSGPGYEGISSLEEREGKGDPDPGSATPQVDSTEKAQTALGTDFKSGPVFSWYHMNYDVTITKGEQRRLLNDVSGYVAPVKMTALMGESGAGKTTLLNTLANRVGPGVIAGDRLVNAVREALLFSAELRQPKSVPIEEKRAYVEEVVKMCAMDSYADAIVGIVGEGLNVEQRTRLTIGVELAAKPQLLLFLDESTSGLDSQSAWAIVQFLRSLADRGQAILCTLLQAAICVLLLRKGGQTYYIGELGTNAGAVISYFERNGARQCQPVENPAEYMLDVISAGATAYFY